MPESSYLTKERVAAARANFLATFMGGYSKTTELEIFRHGMETVFNWLAEIASAPIAMPLFCPACRTRHIDEGEFATRPHKSHTCQNPTCGLTWMQHQEVPTVGVLFLPGTQNTEPKR